MRWNHSKVCIGSTNFHSSSIIPLPVVYLLYSFYSTVWHTPVSVHYQCWRYGDLSFVIFPIFLSSFLSCLRLTETAFGNSCYIHRIMLGISTLVHSPSRSTHFRNFVTCIMFSAFLYLSLDFVAVAFPHIEMWRASLSSANKDNGGFPVMTGLQIVLYSVATRSRALCWNLSNMCLYMVMLHTFIQARATYNAWD